MKDDTIYRQVAIKAVVDLPNCYNGYSDTYDKSCIIGLLEELPPAQPERKTGKWIKIHWKAFRCSVCSRLSEYNTNFCPNCGANMRGEQE